MVKGDDSDVKIFQHKKKEVESDSKIFPHMEKWVMVMLRFLGGHLDSGLSVDDVHPPQVLGRHRDVVVDVARHFLHLVFFFSI